ncbi:MAG: tannase/feruloyl esterase family alpha/beta hydrolase, partial [Acidobacteria bacterium]|nr:tannase/feruloyl esterase family alpha/beta hydrolase [Acidobacteriota bacterium]
MNNRYLWSNVACLIIGLCAAPLRSNEASIVDTEAAAACRQLTSADFAGIQDAPTQVTEAKLIPAAGDVPAYCNVRGYITPNVGIELKLPTENWNGKFLEMGCGGLCGVLFSSYSKNPGHDCDHGLRKGYACIASDQGHQGTMGDGKWAYNNLQAQIDYAFRATHVAALAGKAITEHYYGKAPRKSYFWGCSGGGRQGMVEAQKFPWDFDGIVVVDAAINLSDVLMSYLWNTHVATQDGKALFRPADVKWLHEAVVAKCDMDDGVKDGVIGNPLACKIDPSEWACKAGQKEQCLSAAQAEAFAKIYAGPTNSKGEILIGGFVPGMEFGIPTTTKAYSLSRDFFQYMGFMAAPGPSWKPSDFDFDRDYKRLALAQALLEDANPDLHKFKAAGGKLILAHAWTDSLPPLNTIDYYETAERTMGGREATQDFFRLFMVPGMDHCSGGAGAYAIDYLSSLENWTEKGQAPDVMIGAHV